MLTVGYIGMLAVRESYRRKGIGKALVRQVLQRMKAMKCTSATLETEVTNVTAQKLYQTCFGFVREEMLVRYYLNWNDAYRLRLWFANTSHVEKDGNGRAAKALPEGVTN
uniref:N-acetyltransferase domain-containing protein n=1 Tax=Entomoneis paludosa TaxID=265537 RepID=A0A7S2V9W3_9STRA|mmetsp:Transcript_13667/g.28236  ORF Transcript_13667/g.28236 Transcript_13667/m.28236 type:complete len:110 (+) Transcript_13667:3-332(+)